MGDSQTLPLNGRVAYIFMLVEMESPSLWWKPPDTPTQREPAPTKCEFGGHVQKLCDNEDCNFCFERSLASFPEACTMFVGVANNKTPRQLFGSTHSSAIWECPDCPHSWSAPVHNVAMLGSRCPFCFSGKLCDDEACQPCYESSVASFSSNRVAFSSSVGGKSARQISKGSMVQCCWTCSTCPHDFKARPLDICTSGRRCPFCAIAGNRLCDKTDCNHCFRRSLASHPAASRFRGLVGVPTSSTADARNILMYAKRRGRWECDDHGVWEAIISNVTHLGNGCPRCVHPMEAVVYKWMAGLAFEVTAQWARSWCRKTRHLPFDFHIGLPTASIVELDGEQHFEPQAYFGGMPKFKSQRENDLHKMRCAIAKGLPFVRLLTATVRKDSKDWRAWLLHVFEHKCRLRNGVAPLILQDHPLYHQMHDECLRADPLIPIVEFVAMP